MYRAFCMGGINAEDPFNSVDNVENGVMVFFRDYFAAALNMPAVKAVVLILFLAYLVRKTAKIFEITNKPGHSLNVQ